MPPKRPARVCARVWALLFLELHGPHSLRSSSSNYQRLLIMQGRQQVFPAEPDEPRAAGQPEPWQGPRGPCSPAPEGPASSRGAASPGRARAVAATWGLCAPTDARLPFPRPARSALRVPAALAGCLVTRGWEIAPTLPLRAPARPDGHQSNCVTSCPPPAPTRTQASRRPGFVCSVQGTR